MKALMGSGLCLAMALMSAQTFAQENQSGSVLPTLGAASPLIASSPITPVSYTESGAAGNSGIGLGRPIAVSGQSQESTNPPDFRPQGLTLDRPVPLFRGQAPDLSLQPVPINQSSQPTIGTPPNTVTVISQPGRMVPVPISGTVTEYIPPMPRVMQDASISGSCGCACGPVYSGATAILDGGCPICAADCGCGCFNEPTCGCGCGDDCGYRGRRFYASASYLGWSFQSKNIPPLVTVSPAGTPDATTGKLGQPTTTILFDSNSQENPFHSGGRFNLGIWGPGGCWALEADFLFLGQNSVNATFGSNGNPQYARPVILMGQETREIVTGPIADNPNDVLIGSVSVNSYSYLWGLELNARQKLFCGPIGWIDMLYGYRHLDLSEGISIREDLVERVTTDGVSTQGIQILDQFNTRNVFNGGQIGIQGETHPLPNLFPRLFLGSSFKIALGAMQEQVNIAGALSSQALSPTLGPISNYNQGLLATNTNSGNHQQTRFAVVPEMNLKLGLEINDHWRAWAGYDFLFMSDVVRPGDQIDRRISQVPLTGNGSTTFIQVPPPGYPAVLFKTTSFYAQGVSFGLQYRW